MNLKSNNFVFAFISTIYWVYAQTTQPTNLLQPELQNKIFIYFTSADLT